MILWRVVEREALVSSSAEPKAAMLSSLRVDLGLIGATIRSADTTGAGLAELSASLSKTLSYPKLLDAASAVGCRVESISFQNFEISAALKRKLGEVEAADKAMRAALSRQQQQQQITEMEMKHSKKSAEERHSLERGQQEHQLALEAEAHAANAALERKSNGQVLHFLGGLKDRGVDVN